MKTIVLFLSTLFTVTLFYSCKPSASEEPAPAQETGAVKIEFDNQFKQDPDDPESYDPLVFNSSVPYKNAANQDYTITMFKYYISNVELLKADGSSYKVPESYYLIDASVSTDAVVSLSNVPLGNYTGIRYVIGVDAARSNAGAGSGALAQSLGMYWTWNMGYIFLKLEGTSPQSSDPDHKIQYHIGGFQDPNSAIQTVEHSFNTSTLRVAKVGIPVVHIMVEASKVAENISFAATPAIHMPGSTAVGLSQQYKNMFAFDHIHN